MAARTLLTLAAILGATLTPAGTLPARISAELAGVDDNGVSPVIVRYKQVPSEERHARVASRGGVLKMRLDVIRSAAYTMSGRLMRELANDPDVEFISPDHPVHALLDSAEPAINANIAFSSGFTGQGVGVAIIDSGIMPENDLGNRIVYNADFAPNTGNDYFDRYGHGTHVADIVGGNAAMSSGPAYKKTFLGIAPNANLVNLRVLDQNGEGTDSSVIAGIQAAISLKGQYNIRVMNLSLGRAISVSYTQDPLCQAVEAAWQAGIVVVVAAGNMGRDNTYGENGYGTIGAPGNDPYVITVGAMNDMGTPARADDVMTSYSSKGPTSIDFIVKPDLVAPGNHIIAAVPSGAALTNLYPDNEPLWSYYVINANAGRSTDYFTLNGTSMAAPMVSGTAALMLQKDPTLTPDLVKARLMKSATKNFPAVSTVTDALTGSTYTIYYDMFTVGAGYLDAWGALNESDTLSSWAPMSAMSPTVSVNAATGAVTLVTGSHVVWGSGSVWDTHVVWGSTNLSGSTLVSGSHVVWGSATDAGFQVIWGDHVVWGSSSEDDSESSNAAVYGDKAHH